MKKIIALLLVAVMLFSLVACGAKKEAEPSKKQDAAEEVKKEEPKTVGGKLLADFEENTDGSAQEIAERVTKNEVLPFDAVIMEVEPGFLMGFDNAEITGFKEAVTFAPMMGTIPFLGYIFVLEDGVDATEFIGILERNANLRWNICTEADELTVKSVGDKVFFLMSPSDFEEESQ